MIIAITFFYLFNRFL